jgi:predicted TIM-barrel fold metal-dependent hydrolase
LNIFDEPKIDTHCHVLDPNRFPYPCDVAYKPSGQEMGGAEYFKHLMISYGVEHALLVGPNSGYGTDNRCLLASIKEGHGRFKGIAVVDNHCSEQALIELRDQGVVGIAFNVALHGVAYYADIEPLLHRLKELEMYAQFQVEADLLCLVLPMIKRSGVKVLIDHCGRPVLEKGVKQEGFQALLKLGQTQRAVVKLSGFAKFSRLGYPFADADPFVEALLGAFGLEQCTWASDWPYLKAPYRVDYGPVLRLVEKRFTQRERQALMWETPQRLFGF